MNLDRFKSSNCSLNRLRNSLIHFWRSRDGQTTKTRFMRFLAFISKYMMPASMVFPNPTSSAMSKRWLALSRNLAAGLNWYGSTMVRDAR